MRSWTEAEADSYRAKVDVVAAGQRAGRLDDGVPAVDLFAMVLRITESWLDAPPALMAVAGPDPRSEQRLGEHRAALVEAVRRITAPQAAARKTRDRGGADELRR